MDELHIPIDIHTGKLIEWLISRRHVKKDWQSGILNIRQKINNAIQDMPVNDKIADLLDGAYINYFHCLQIIEILKLTEADTKNVFGRYGSQRMKDWQEVVKLYERDHLYLAECAQILVNNVNYEVPSLKKQIIKLEQTREECERREIELQRVQHVLNTEFRSLCDELNISGTNLRSEINAKRNELPRIYIEVAEKVKNVVKPLQFYKTFVKQTQGSADHISMDILNYVIVNGNTTVYEYKYKSKPATVIPHPLDEEYKEVQSEKEHVLDLDVDIETDYDYDFGEDDLENCEIDFGDLQDEAVSFEHRPDNVVPSDGIARDVDALSVLDEPEHRNKFINDLLELESFLQIRVHEMTDTSSTTNIVSLLEDVPVHTIEEVTSMLNHVQEIIKLLVERPAHHLHNIKHFPRYVEMLVSQLTRPQKTMVKVITKIADIKQKANQASIDEQTIKPTLALVIQKTKELQTQIEKSVSALYNGRPVNLMGGMNTL